MSQIDIKNINNCGILSEANIGPTATICKHGVTPTRIPADLRPATVSSGERFLIKRLFHWGKKEKGGESEDLN